MIYIGLPQWSHPKWVPLGITSLEDYARHFNCVEGNTTLYALPKADIVSRWYEQTSDNFRFCFKFPATISHQAALRDCDDLTLEFFHAWRRWRRALASSGYSCPPPLAPRICLRCGSSSTVYRQRSPTASRSDIRNSSPKARPSRRSIADCINAMSIARSSTVARYIAPSRATRRWSMRNVKNPNCRFMPW